MSNPLAISAPARLPFIDFEREFDAPVEAVFRTHKEPDLVKEWLGPGGYQMEIERAERVGPRPDVRNFPLAA